MYIRGFFWRIVSQGLQFFFTNLIIFNGAETLLAHGASAPRQPELKEIFYGLDR
jgi:hypothetical protein